MNKNIKLYINGIEADLTEDISLPITYVQEDLTNPTIVKNSFSKTVTLPGTKTNNSIFGQFYKLDRFTINHTGNTTVGVEYDPSKRIPFQIYKNSNIVESGYLQLNAVNVDSYKVSYDTTLYGGLGDFFYGLSYKEDGEKLTLADLNYKDNLTFKINKEYIQDCFNNPMDGRLLTFIPSLNGLYDDFDNDTCLINTNNSTIFPTEQTEGNIKYTTYNGFGLAKLNKSYDEWEIRDLRSYKQRPALRLATLVTSILDNSGYKYELDPKFFNSRNPYWNDTFIALPLLSSNGEDDVTQRAQLDKFLSNQFIVGESTVGGGSDDNVTWWRDGVSGYFTVQNGEGITVSGDRIDLSKVSDSSTIEVNLDINITFTATGISNEDELYMCLYRSVYNEESNYTQTYLQTRTFLQFRLDVVNSDGTCVESPLYNFAGERSYDDSFYDIYKNNTTVGTFKRISDNKYAFVDENNNNTFRLTVKASKKSDTIRLRLNTSWVKQEAGKYSGASYLFEDKILNENVPENTVLGNIESDWDVNEYSLEIKSPSGIGSGTVITQDTILKTENTPADYLLNIGKLFGWYYVKDINEKKISIMSRETFFKNKVVNIEDRLDYSKNFNINPVLFDKKWYKMTLNTPETYFAKKYNKEYDLDYGQKRIDTGYNFNTETTNLYEDSIFDNVISVRDSDKYYRTFYDKSGNEVPCFVNDNLSYQLFKKNDTTKEITSVEQNLYGVNIIDKNKTIEWNGLRGTDCMVKSCFYSLDNDEKSLEEISSSILFYNGPRDLLDIKNKPIKYWITDDLPEMADLNDGQPCWLYTNSDKDTRGNTIAILRTTLPQFIKYKTAEIWQNGSTGERYYVDTGNVKQSLDFGLPKEIYIDGLNYSEDATIYNNYWKRFYNDQFNVNTKKVTCYVNLSDWDVKQELLRQFYYFNNGIWILNKIDNYDVTSNNTTRCEFIKVQDITNYTK